MPEYRKPILKEAARGLALMGLGLLIACGGDATKPAEEKKEEKKTGQAGSSATGAAQKIFLDAQGNPTTPPAGAVTGSAAPQQDGAGTVKTFTGSDGKTRTAVKPPKSELSATKSADGQIRFVCNQFACADPTHDHTARDLAAGQAAKEVK